MKQKIYSLTFQNKSFKVVEWSKSDNPTELILCLHGFGRNPEDFASFAHELKDKERMVAIGFWSHEGSDSFTPKELKEGLNSPTLDPKNLLDLLNRTDVWRKPERFDELIKVANLLKLPTEQLTKSYDLAKKVDIAQVVQDVGEQGSSTGTKIKQLIEDRRLLAIKDR